MIILRKKRLFLIAGCLMLSLGIFTITQYEVAKKYGETAQTVALPVSQKVIVVDARSW